MSSLPVRLLFGLALRGAALACRAEGCIDFRWDVTRERALFAQPPATLAAGRQSSSAPALSLDRPYELQLFPQSEVAFAAPPGKSTYGEQVYAGLALVAITQPGIYRVAIDMPVWVDLAVDNQLVRAFDYQGQTHCEPPHKILAYELKRPGRFVLQFSGEIAQRLRVTVTRSPGSAP